MESKTVVTFDRHTWVWLVLLPSALMLTLWTSATFINDTRTTATQIAHFTYTLEWSPSSAITKLLFLSVALKFVEIIAILSSEDKRAVDAGDWVLVRRCRARVANSKPITPVTRRYASFCMVFASFDRLFTVNAKPVHLKLILTIHASILK